MHIMDVLVGIAATIFQTDGAKSRSTRRNATAQRVASIVVIEHCLTAWTLEVDLFGQLVEQSPGLVAYFRGTVP